MNEADLMSDLSDLLAKHKLKGGVLLVPNHRGTCCLRIGADDKFIAGMMRSIADDIDNGVPSTVVRDD